MSGANTFVFSSSNNYSGGTTISSGTLGFSPSALGSGPINFAGGVLQYSPGNTTDISSEFVTSAGQPVAVDTLSNNVTWAGPLVGSSGSLTKYGSGVLA